MQHIKTKTIKNMFSTKSYKTYILATKFDFAIPSENAYNCVDILGQWPWPDIVTIFSQLFLSVETVKSCVVCCHICIVHRDIGSNFSELFSLQYVVCLTYTAFSARVPRLLTSCVCLMWTVYSVSHKIETLNIHCVSEKNVTACF